MCHLKKQLNFYLLPYIFYFGDFKCGYFILLSFSNESTPDRAAKNFSVLGSGLQHPLDGVALPLKTQIISLEVVFSSRLTLDIKMALEAMSVSFFKKKQLQMIHLHISRETECSLSSPALAKSRLDRLDLCNVLYVVAAGADFHLNKSSGENLQLKHQDGSEWMHYCNEIVALEVGAPYGCHLS